MLHVVVMMDCFQTLCCYGYHANNEQPTRAAASGSFRSHGEYKKLTHYVGTNYWKDEMLYVGFKQFIVVYCSLILIVSYLFSGWFTVLFSTPLHYVANNVPDLTGKFAVITGANTGIGKFTALHLARRRCHVIITTRNKIKGLATLEEIKSTLRREKLELIHDSSGDEMLSIEVLNLQDLRDVSRFSNSVMLKYKKKLDYLFLNAGIMMTPFDFTVDGFESQIATNHIGHFLIVKKWMRWIRRSGTRVISVSSSAHISTYPGGIDFNRISSNHNYSPRLAYGQSKLANILFSKELAVRLEGSNATSNAIHPGMVQSELGRHINMCSSFPCTIIAFPIFLLFELAKMNTAIGSWTQVMVATTSKFGGSNGKLYCPMGVKTRGSKFASDEGLQKKLWNSSEKWVSKYL